MSELQNVKSTSNMHMLNCAIHVFFLNINLI